MTDRPATDQRPTDQQLHPDPMEQLFTDLLKLLPPDVRGFASLKPSVPEIKQELQDTAAVRDGFRNEARMCATEIKNPQYVDRRLLDLRKDFERARERLEAYEQRVAGLESLRDHYVAEAVRLDKRVRNLRKLADWRAMVDRAVDVVMQVEDAERRVQRLDVDRVRRERADQETLVVWSSDWTTSDPEQSDGRADRDGQAVSR